MAERRMLAAIMFTDIEGFTTMMNQRENVAMANLKMHNKILDELVFKFSGLVIKSIGDSYLIEFPSAINAVQCALDAQKAFTQCEMGDSDGKPLKVRMAIHVGDVIVDNDDVYGDGVNIASRLQSVAPGGGICLSREAYAQVRSKFRDHFVGVGSRVLKGLSEPVEIFISKEFAPAAAEESSDGRPALNIVVPETSMIRSEEPSDVPFQLPGCAPTRPLSADERRVAAAKTATLPSPPPAPSLGPPGPTGASWVVFAGLFILFFGGRWLAVTHADWLGGGWGAALIAATVIFNRRRGGVATALGLILFVLIPFSFFRMGGVPLDGWPSFDVLLVAGLGLVAGAAAFYLGFIDPQPDRRLAILLLLASTGLLMVAGSGRTFPESASWTEGLARVLGGQARELLETGGAWRWGGFLYVYAGWKISGMSGFDPNDWSRQVGSDGRQLNWNR